MRWNWLRAGVHGAVCIAWLMAASVVSADKPQKQETPAQPAKQVAKQNATPEQPVKIADAAKKADTTKKADATKNAGAAKQQPAVDPKSTKTPAKPGENPLGNILKRVFGGIKPQPPRAVEKPVVPQPAADVAADPAETFQSKGDEIDRRAPHDPSQTKILRKADARIRSGDWEQAMQILQYLLNAEEDSLVRLQSGKWVSIRSEANRMLGAFPPDELKNYRLRQGPIASQMLQAAYERSDPSGFVDVATRYFHTAAGQRAANYLGTLHFDRGEFGMAARWFNQLLNSRAEITRDSKWRLKAAFALHFAGDRSDSERLLKNLPPSEEGHQLGGLPIDLRSWLDEAGSVAKSGNPVLDDWTMLFGTSSRTGTAVGGEPLLLPRWSSTSTFNPAIHSTIDELNQDLSDLRRATVPASFPLTVDGKVIFRTLRGVQVVDVQTGQALWETPTGVSAEQILTGSRSSRSQMRFGRFNGFSYSGSQAERHSLTSLLYRNGAWGILSSDGDQLFVIEDHAILSGRQTGYSFGFNPSRNDRYRRDWATNKLVAYQLATGRPLWEIGGTAMDEPFDLPLAGHYFCGTPVADGAELFIVGEKDNEIRLFALDRQTGKPKWSQMIATSDAKIEQDIGRRWWTSQIAVSKGVLVCPTTVGWLVAVDRMNHSVLWAHRYSKSKPKSSSSTTIRRGRGRSNSNVQMGPLNSRWCPSAPIVVGNRVIYAPSEEGVFECLNLVNGTRVWRKLKGTFLYLAGVFDKRVLLVGIDSVAAVSLEDGQTIWSLPIAAAAGRPSGHGVAVENQYHLPLSSGQLWSIDLKDGRVVKKSFLPERHRALGNLVMYRGTLLSLGGHGLRAFEQRDAVVGEIERRKARNPLDVWALLREADIHLLNRDHDKALTSLRKIPSGRVNQEFRARYRTAMIDSLQAIIRADAQAGDRELEELGGFISGNEERFLYRRLSAKRFFAREEYRAAFDLYWEMSRSTSDRMIDRGNRSRVKLREDLWLAGELADLWKKMPNELRTDLDKRIAAESEVVIGGDVDRQKQFMKLFGFHRSAVDVTRKVVETYVEAGELVQAENLLLKLSQHSDRTVAAGALLRLAQLLRDSKLTRDADYYQRLLEHQYADQTLADGQTVRDVLAALKTGQTASAGPNQARLTWGDVDLKMTRTGAGYSSTNIQVLNSTAFRLPFFHNFRIQIDHHYQQPRLEFVNAADDTLYWSLPLRSSPQTSANVKVPVVAVGHQFIVWHRGVLHCLSPVERKVIWTRSLPTQRGGSSRFRSSRPTRLQPMRQGSGIVSNSSLAQQSSGRGMLAVANGRYLCVYGRRGFTVLDAMTGETRWTRDGLPPGAQIVGTDDVLYVVPPDRSQAVALRALDGKQLDVPGFANLLSRAVSVIGNSFVLVESNTIASFFGLQKHTKTTVRLHNPRSGQDRWNHEFPGDAYFSLLAGKRIVAVEPSGALKWLDLETGRVQNFEGVPKADLKSTSRLHVFVDHDNLYLNVNRRSSQSYSYSSGISTVGINGSLFAFDRTTGKRLWQQQVTQQNLVLNRLDHLPLLVFYTRKSVRKNNIYYSLLKLQALDKQTGRRLIDVQSASNSSFRSIDVNMTDRFIELRSYSDRIRLNAVDRQASAAR